MKTPQEEAEEMALKTSTGLFNKDRLNSSQVAKVTDAILDNIPLAELIAVARAAKNLLSACGSISQYEHESHLSDALQALRATGKVML